MHGEALGQFVHGHHAVLVTFRELFQLEGGEGATGMDPPETIRIILW